MFDLLSYLVTFLAGLGAGIVIKIRIDASKKNNSVVNSSNDRQGSVNQYNNTVGGNLSGRDVNVTRDQ
ncbi:hypothetical protein [Paracoccus sediminilitoris]|uniref:hypothetical protein n=1 Tax=Paracoccus sediminilitoris TaxID=2202419 RepID=UPI0011B9492F|nr:hypothetical protein [Paracoccus sediminilitoris]